MENLYFKYLDMKSAGIIPEWASISKVQMKKLYSNKEVSDQDIANLFDISINQVRYKRKKFGLDAQQISILRFFNDTKNTQLIELNQNSKERLLSDKNVDRLAIGFAHYFFRNGPVEDMHADGKLSEEDMKILNKYMANKIASVMFLAKENRWLELELLLEFHMKCGSDWDKPEIEMDEVYEIFELYLKKT